LLGALKRRLHGAGITAIVSGASLLALASSSAGAQDQARPYVGDLGQAIAAIVIFLILLLVLGRFGWKPMIRHIQQREQAVADAIRKAEERETESKDLLAHYQARLKHAESDAQDLLARGRKEASDAREQIIEVAHQEAQKAAQRAKDDISIAKDSALRELRGATAELAADIAARLIRKNLTEQDQRNLLEDSLKEIGDKA